MHGVLFLCMGSSCRSQMAEAIVNARHPGWRAFSTGMHEGLGAFRPAGHELLAQILCLIAERSWSAQELYGWANPHE